MAGVGLVRLGGDLSLDDEFVIVEVAAVCRYAEVFAHVLGAEALLTGHQGLVQLLAVTRADDLGTGIAEEFLHRLRQHADGGGVRLLDKEIAGVGVLKGKLDEIDRFIEIHQKAGHLGIGDGNGVASLDLVDEQRDDRAATAHDVAIAGTADDGTAALCRYAGVSGDDVFHQSLGNAHRVDRVRRLVGRQADDALDAAVDRRVEHVVRALYVGADGFHREELAGRHLLQSRRMEHIVDAPHGVLDGLGVADVADVELHFIGIIGKTRLQIVAHIVLLLLIAREDTDLADIACQKMLEYGMSERTRTAGDHQGSPCKAAHIILSFIRLLVFLRIFILLHYYGGVK